MKKILTLSCILLFLSVGLWNSSKAQVIDGGTCPTAIISYNGSPYCSDAGTARVSITGTRGGIYSCTDPSILVDPDYGFVDLSNSVPGTYTVFYTIPAAHGCPDFVTQSDITITQAPAASIAYSGSPFCTGSGIAAVTFNGTAGGTFSADPGLIIDPNNGDINLEFSNPGNYNVYYVVSNGNCITTAITAIAVSAQPNATIAYNASPYCSTAGVASVNISGTSGGIYSCTDPGLVINSSTGDIDLASSAPGTYTVQYYVSPAGNCGDFTTSTNITIISGAKAIFSYPNSPYCPLQDTALIAFSGTTGGTFSADPGLNIDPVTGTVNIQNSSNGTFNVYYNLSGSCGLLTNTTTITIDPIVCRPATHLPQNGLITIYPNPVTSRVINLQMTGMQDGQYNIKLSDENGVEVLVKQILFKGGNGMRQIELPKTIIKGYYRMEISMPNGAKTSKAVVLVN